MKVQSGRTYKSEWARLATYLAAQWPGTRLGSPVSTAIALLEHLRTIEESGVLPAYGIEGEYVPTVEQLVMRASVVGTASDTEQDTGST